MIDDFKHIMMKEFEMIDLGLMSYFLGIEVIQGNDGIFIHQRKFATEFLMEIKIKKRKKPKMKMLKRILAHHPFYLKGLQGANLKN